MTRGIGERYRTNKLLGVRMGFSDMGKFNSVVALMCLTTGVSTASWALTQGEIESMARDAHEYSQKIIDGSLKSQREMFDTAALAAKGTLGQNSPAIASTGRQTLIFVSWSMGDSNIKSLIQSLQDEEHVGLVFRGIPDGVKLADAMRKLSLFASYGNGNVALLLDPPKFQKYNVTVVPTMVVESDDKLVISVRGVTSPEYLKSALKDGKKGDIGIDGATRDIAERDLIEVMKERASKLDFEKIKSGAIKRFWDKQNTYPLPPAPKDERRTIDPTVVAAIDMRDINGNLIMPAGTRVNPLDRMPFTQRLVVFDPNSKRQIDFARSQILAFGAKQRVTLIATAPDRSRASEQIQELSDLMGASVHLLAADVQDRFKLRFAPSVVTAEGRVFVVQETYIRSDF